jgi:hypothetical protein
MAMRTASGKTMTATLSDHITGVAAPGLMKATYAELEDVLKDSLPLVPVDTGALRGSGYVAEPWMEDDHVIDEVGYGGVATKINPKTLEPTTAYALAVHENLEAHHEVGQAKYLEVPFDEHTQNFGSKIAARMKTDSAPTQDESGGAGDVE